MEEHPHVAHIVERICWDAQVSASSSAADTLDYVGHHLDGLVRRRLSPGGVGEGGGDYAEDSSSVAHSNSVQFCIASQATHLSKLPLFAVSL